MAPDTWPVNWLQDLAILERLDRIIRREQRKEGARGRLCPRGCGERVYYSPDDTVFLHANGEYFCGR